MRAVLSLVVMLLLVNLEGACFRGAGDCGDRCEASGEGVETEDANPADGADGGDESEGRDGSADSDGEGTLLDRADVPDTDESAGDALDVEWDGDSPEDGDSDVLESDEGGVLDADSDDGDEDAGETCDGAWRAPPVCEPAIPCRSDLSESECYAACGFVNVDVDTGRVICGCLTTDGGRPCSGAPGECESHCSPPVPFRFPACVCDGCPCGYCEFWSRADTCACMGDGTLLCP